MKPFLKIGPEVKKKKCILRIKPEFFSKNYSHFCFKKSQIPHFNLRILTFFFDKKTYICLKTEKNKRNKNLFPLILFHKIGIIICQVVVDFKCVSFTTEHIDDRFNNTCFHRSWCNTHLLGNEAVLLKNPCRGGRTEREKRTERNTCRDPGFILRRGIGGQK